MEEGKKSSLIKRLYGKFKAFIKAVFTDETWTCEVCKKEKFDDGFICEDCRKALPFIAYGNYCNHCGRKTVAKETYCINCKNKLTEVDLCRSVFNYEGKVVLLISNFKFRNHAYLKDFFSEEMEKVMRDNEITADVITFVPMTEKARRKRGYNQTELLAKELSLKTDVPYAELLKKTKETKAQVGLTKSERQDNLKGSFKVVDKKAVEGKSVLLIDDVTTTGATSEVIAGYLKKAGAKKVTLLTVASVSIENKKEEN